MFLLYRIYYIPHRKQRRANKTIDGREYTIIESKVDAIFCSYDYLVKLRPVRQYSDGSVISEPDFITASLNPYTNKTLPEEWNRTLGGIYDEFGRYEQSLQQINDGGYILIGSIEMYTPGMMYNNYAYLIKTDTNGNEQWNRTFEDIGLKNAYSVWQTSDGGYILTSGTDLYSKGSTDAWVIKTDVNGKQEWNRTFGSDFFNTVYSIEQTHDGGYLLAGSKGSSETGYCACLVKTDANGSDLWLVTVAGMEIDTAQSEIQTSDNNVTENLQSPPGKSIPGFEFVGAIFLVLLILL